MTPLRFEDQEAFQTIDLQLHQLWPHGLHPHNSTRNVPSACVYREQKLRNQLRLSQKSQLSSIFKLSKTIQMNGFFKVTALCLLYMHHTIYQNSSILSEMWLLPRKVVRLKPGQPYRWLRPCTYTFFSQSIHAFFMVLEIYVLPCQTVIFCHQGEASC